MLNPYSAEERIQHMVSSVYRATRSHFSHLPIRHIINPPRDMFDAKLARQISIHILNVEFAIPRRRLVATLGLARSTVLFGIRTVDSRLDEPVFRKAYQRILARSHELFMGEMYADAHEEAA